MYLKMQPRLWTSEDYSATCSTWTSKTASGLLPCIWCSNVTLQSSNLSEGSDYLVPVSCPDFHKFDIRTEEGFHTVGSMLANAPRNELAELEKSCGFVYMPDTCTASITVHLFGCLAGGLVNLRSLPMAPNKRQGKS